MGSEVSGKAAVGKGPHLATKFFLVLLTGFVALVAASHDDESQGLVGFEIQVGV